MALHEAPQQIVPIPEQKIAYGNWGYGTQTPIADYIASEIKRHKEVMKNEPRTRVYEFHKGALELWNKL